MIRLFFVNILNDNKNRPRDLSLSRLKYCPMWVKHSSNRLWLVWLTPLCGLCLIFLDSCAIKTTVKITMNLLCVQIMKCAMTVRWIFGVKKRLRVNLSRWFYWWPRLESNQWHADFQRYKWLFLNSIFIGLILPQFNCHLRSDLNGRFWRQLAEIIYRQMVVCFSLEFWGWI